MLLKQFRNTRLDVKRYNKIGGLYIFIEKEGWNENNKCH